jgi:hypothetical protein
VLGLPLGRVAAPRFAAAVPAAVAPLAVAWPHGAPALGAGALIALLPVALAEGIPRPRLSFAVALAFAVWIAIAGDAGLARGGAAGIAVAAAALVSFRTRDDVRLAAGTFGATAAVVTVVAALHGTTGVRADILAATAVIGMAVSAGFGFWAVAAADLVGVLALPSRAGLAAAAALLIALAHAERRNVVPSLIAVIVIASAWLGGAPAAHSPFVHGAWRHASGLADSYERLGVTGAALFVALLVALLSDLPRALSPAAFAVTVGAVLAPLEGAAPLWLLVGFAAGRPAYDRVMATGRERRLDQLERSLESHLRDLDAERRRLLERRGALDDRESDVSALEAVSTAREEKLARRESAAAALEQEVAKREAALESGTWAISKAPTQTQPQAAEQPQTPPAERPVAPPQEPQQPPRFRPVHGAPEAQPLFRPARQPGAQTAPEPVAELQPASPTRNFRALELLVNSRLPEFPDRADEWRRYLVLLGSYVVNGVLPESFDPLIREVFGPILPV